MGFVDRFERRLQGAVGDAFARVFGGNVMAQEVEAELQREALDRLQTLDGGIRLAPNSYVITLNDTDHTRFDSDKELTLRALSRNLADYIREQGWQTYGHVQVVFAASDSLHTGQFRAIGTVDPDTAAPNYNAPSGSPPSQPYPTPGWAPTLLLDDGSDRRYQLRDGSNILGRGPTADFRVADTGVSREHADVRWDGHVATVVDNNSTNGTSVNNASVTQCQLTDGDVIQIGHTDITFRFA